MTAPAAARLSRKGLIPILTLLFLLLGDIRAGAQPAVVPGRILMKPKAGVAASEMSRLLERHGASESGRIGPIDVRILRVPERNLERVLEALAHNPNIEFAEPDVIVAPEFTPNDPNFGSEWHLAKIGAPGAWDVQAGSSGVIIAICDTGVDSTHPDLAAHTLPGWNFYENTSDSRDVQGHGTAVAGTAAAIGDNGVGVAGVTLNCGILPLRITDSQGYAYYSTMAQAVTYAADHGARVANLSFKASNSSSVRSAAQYFNSKGGVLTVAAGNDGQFDATADNPYLLTVSATDSNDSLASWSATGNNVDLAAPGVSVLTTTRGGGYGWGSGTSFAAPCVAGVAALMISENPSLSAADVMNLLGQTADDLGAAGWDPSYGWGRVNAAQAVQASVGSAPSDSTPPMAVINAPASGSIVSGSVTVETSAADNVGVAKIELYLDGVRIGASSGATANFLWDTTTSSDGAHTLEAVALDAAGNSGSSAPVGVTVQNLVADATPPTVQITSPLDGESVSRNTKIYVEAGDNVGVTRVDLYIDGNLEGSSISSSSFFNWNVNKADKGPHTLEAVAYDTAGNASLPALVTVWK